MIETLAFKFHPQKDFFILDQTLLPERKEFIKIEHPLDMASAIKKLQVRGANLIGITAGLSLAHYSLKNPKAKDFESLAEKLKSVRPTALHLSKAVHQILKLKTPEERLKQALDFYEQDKLFCEQIAQRGSTLIKKGEGLLTYCNTGALATGGMGTALGIIKQAFKDNKQNHTWICETRPLNQGSRLSFWELQEEGIPSTLICDNMISALMSEKKVNKVFVGADRISQNGDTANKIGTLNLAILCQHFKIPFYVVAPSSVIDQNLSQGQDIPIEQRDSKEISSYWVGKADLWNPAFDITPKELITALITEKEMIKF